MSIIPAPFPHICAEPRNMATFACCLMTGFVAAKGLLTSFALHKTGIFSEEVSLYAGRETLRRYLHKSYFWHMSPLSQTVIHQLSNRVQLAQFLVFLLQLHSNVFCCAALFTSLFLMV